MLKKYKQYLSLIEILISLMIWSIALPICIYPVYRSLQINRKFINSIDQYRINRIIDCELSKQEFWLKNGISFSDFNDKRSNESKPKGTFHFSYHDDYLNTLDISYEMTRHKQHPKSNQNNPWKRIIAVKCTVKNNKQYAYECIRYVTIIRSDVSWRI